MRDSQGAAWIFSLCITFTIIFTAYIAISVNYARAFRVKSNVVSKIEEHEGYDDAVRQDIASYLANEGYVASGTCASNMRDNDDKEWNMVDCIDDNAPAGRCNICVYKNPNGNKEADLCAERSSYRVVAFFKFDLPLVGYWTVFQVGGESRYIYDFANSPGC